MITKDDNLLIKLLKMGVGLPTGRSTCGCGAAPASAQEAPQPQLSEKASTDCGCAACCPQDEKPPAQA